MAERFVQTHIRNLPLFAQLAPPQIGVVAGIVQVVRFEPGQLVFMEGQPTQGLILFVSGRAILTRRGSSGLDERIGTVEAGQYVNETALYSAGVETESLHVVESAIVLIIPRARFVQLMSQYPEIRANVRVQTQAVPAAPQGASASSAAPASPADPNARESGIKLFKGQRDDETVLYVWRRHWWAAARHGWIAVATMIALFAVALLIAGRAPILALAAAGLAVVIPGVIALYLYFEWINDSVILSDQRVVRVWHQLIGFENTLTEIPLDRVLEVNVSIPPGDPFARLFHYGRIFVKTAGNAGDMTLDMMPNPMFAQSMIFTQRDRLQERLEQGQRDVVRNDIAQALGIVEPAPVRRTQQVPLDSRDNTIGLPFIRTKFVNANGDLVYRKHSSVWIQHVIFPSFVIFAGLVLIVISAALPALPFSGFIGLAAGMFVLIIGAVWFYFADWDWRNDLFIVSGDAVTFIRQRPLWLQNEVERIRISQIDNVKSVVDGLINNILNRGDLRISLIGSDLKDAKVMDSIYDPQEVQAELSRRQSALKTEQKVNDIEQQRQVIKDYLSTYHELQQSGQPTQSQASAPQAAPPTMTYARPATPGTQPVEPPPPPIRDGSRPPRVPRTRPDRE